MRVSATDLESSHHLVSAHNIGSGHEERMNLRHRSIDPPLGTHDPPLAHEFLTGIFESGAFLIHLLSEVTESSFPSQVLDSKNNASQV